MKVFGYVRVSTEEQALHGISLAAQEAKLQYAALYSHDLLEVVIDAGISATTMDRPRLQRTLSPTKLAKLAAAWSPSWID